MAQKHTLSFAEGLNIYLMQLQIDLREDSWIEYGKQHQPIFFFLIESKSYPEQMTLLRILFLMDQPV